MSKQIVLRGMAIVLFGMASGIVSAQTCSAPTTLTSSGSFSGDTSTGSNETGIADVCGGAGLTGAAAVFTWSYNGSASRAGSITVTPTGGSPNFDIALAVIRSTCGSSGACVTLRDSSQNGTSAEAIDLTASAFNTAGTYYLLVSSFGDGSTGNTTGPFSGTVGTLPVELKSFSVE